MKERDKTKELIVEEYLSGDVSYRDMESRYGISSSTLQRWVQAAGVEAKCSEAGGKTVTETQGEPGENLASEVKRLRGELRKSELHNKLLNAMIDIAEEQFEIPIRKKRGARR